MNGGSSAFADYRRQVVRTLDAGVGGERGISFRDPYPDQWYDLGNGAAGSMPTVTCGVPRKMFPPNVDGLRVESLVLCFAPKDGAAVDGGVADRAGEIEDLLLVIGYARADACLAELIVADAAR